MVITFNEIMGSSAGYTSANCSQHGVWTGQGPMLSVCPPFVPPPPAALPVRQPVVGHVVHLCPPHLFHGRERTRQRRPADVGPVYFVAAGRLAGRGGGC